MGEEIIVSAARHRSQYVDSKYNNDINYYNDIHDYYELSRDRLTITKDPLLGCGHYGKVYYGTVRCKKTDRLLPVAVKVAKFETNQSDDDDEEEINERRKATIECQIEALRIELNILAYIQCLNERQHPNIVRLIGTTTDKYNQLYILSEYCEYGNLECYVQQKYINRQFIDEMRNDGNTWNSTQPFRSDCITTSDLLSFAGQIACAMEYLTILHRDVALRNIFLKSNMTVKLGDFGLSRQIYEGSTSYLQSKIADIPVRYTAPESLHFKIFSIESELWTFGVVLWELFTFAQHMPYEKELPNFSVAQLKTFLDSGHRLTPPDMAPNSIQKLMLAVWSEDVQRRPNFQMCQSIIGKALDNRLGMKKQKKHFFEPKFHLTSIVRRHESSTTATKQSIIALLFCATTVTIFSIILIAALTFILDASNTPPATDDWQLVWQFKIVDWRNLSAEYHSKRTKPIKIIRLSHSVASTPIETLNVFNSGQSSAHYIVARNGTIFQLVDESNHTWHDGEQTWNNITNIIGVSIEIEIINRDNEPFKPEQVRSVALLCRQIAERYDISPNNIIGNSDSAPDSHCDPSAYFDWRLFYLVAGFYPHLFDSHLTADEQIHVLHDTSPHFDKNVQRMQRQLKTFGYSIANDRIDGRYGPLTESIAIAFNRHFCPEVFVKEQVVNNKTIRDPKNHRWYRLSQERLDYLMISMTETMDKS